MTERGSSTLETTEAEQSVINPTARHPFAGTPLGPGRKGHQERTIRIAARELWPPDGQPPATLSKAERNRAVWRWYERNGILDVRDQASARHIRRVFNGR